MNTNEQIWLDYLNFTEKYSDKISIPNMGYLLLMFTTKMLMDTAPSDSDCMSLIKQAVDAGIKWHTDEQKDKDNE